MQIPTPEGNLCLESWSNRNPLLSLLHNPCKLKGIFCSDCKFPLCLNQVSPVLLNICSYTELTKNIPCPSCSEVAGARRQNLDLGDYPWSLAGWPTPCLLLLTTSRSCWSEQLQPEVIFKMHSTSSNLAHQIPRAFNRSSTFYRDFIFGSHI